MGSVNKRSKSWYVDLYVKGRRVRKRIGTTKQIALLAWKDAPIFDLLYLLEYWDV